MKSLTTGLQSHGRSLLRMELATSSSCWRSVNRVDPSALVIFIVGNLRIKLLRQLATAGRTIEMCLEALGRSFHEEL